MLASSLTPSKTKRANLTWWSSEIMHRGHIWHDYPWPWVSLAWLLYNLQLDDVKSADFEKSLYAFGQSEKRSMYINMINQYTTLRYIWRTISSVGTNFLPESLCLYLPKSVWVDFSVVLLSYKADNARTLKYRSLTIRKYTLQVCELTLKAKDKTSSTTREKK